MFDLDRLAFAVSFAVFSVSLAFCSGCGTESDEPEGASEAPSAELLDACGAAYGKIAGFGEANACEPLDVDDACDVTHPNNRCEAEWVDYYACIGEKATQEDCACEHASGGPLCNQTEADCGENTNAVLDCLNQG